MCKAGDRASSEAKGTRSMGDTPLHYFGNEAPAWWTNAGDTSYLTYANNTSPSTTAGLGFWADVCASFCVRVYGEGNDEAEFMELDFTVRTAVANHGKCSCYVYRDTAAGSTHANYSSHVPPDDVRVRAPA